MKIDRHDIPNDYRKRAELARRAVEKVDQGKPLQDIINELAREYEPNFFETIGIKIGDAWRSIKEHKTTWMGRASLLVSVIRLILTLKKKDNMESLFKKLKRKLKERSTYAGLATLLAAVGVSINPELLSEIGTALIGIIGVIEIFRKEKEEAE